MRVAQAEDVGAHANTTDHVASLPPPRAPLSITSVDDGRSSVNVGGEAAFVVQKGACSAPA